jgi:hypothetical protein
LSLVVPLVLVECGLRLAAPQSHALNISEWHPHYGWRNRPGARGFYETGEFRFEIAINSLGLRYREIPRAKPPGTFRILALGDSFVLGHGMAAESSFVAVAERELAARSARAGGPRMEILNAGVGKWGTAQEYLYLTQEGFGFEPDVVVLAFCVDNDFENNLDAGVLRLEGDRLVPIESPEPALRVAQRITRAIPGYGFLAAHSHLVNFLRLRAAVLTDRRIAVRAARAAGRPAGTLDFGEATAITTRIMDALVLAVRSAETPLVVLMIPSLAEVDPMRWLIHQQPKDMRPYEAAVAALSAQLDSLGVAVLDPLPELRAASRIEPLYFPRDTHLNAAGSLLVGRILADGLVREGVVPF